MKIIILTPFTDDSQLKKDTKPFVDFVTDKGHKAHVIGTAPKKTSKDGEDQDFAVSISNEIKNADAVIITPSITGIELGGVISLALQHRKTTLAFYEKQKPESILFSATNLISCVKFDAKTANDLETVMKPFLNDIKKKKLLYRFNLMLSREMNVFLSHKSRENGVSKADYVRTLIFRDMGMQEDAQ
jgi:hypothetical protein